MSTLFVLLDGASDNPVPQLDGKTPMDYADMPFLESVTEHTGVTDGRGYTHLFLNEFFTGEPPSIPRAALEALGLGLSMEDRTAYRLSPAVIRNGMIEWAYNAHEFCDVLVPKVREKLWMLDEYNPEIDFFLNGRAVLTMECDDVPDLPSPPIPAPFVEVPGRLGDMVMAVAEDLNGITNYPWGCGRLEKPSKPYSCLGRMTAISDSPTPLGIFASFGHDFRLIQDMEDRFPAAKNALKKGNVFLHMDEVDEYSHQRDPMKKVGVLERIDELMEEHFSDQERIVYFVDHGTSCVTGEHLIMKVPFMTSFDIGLENGSYIPTAEVVPAVMRR
jgi:2,3-bisphosphoglycerate-independent phosphoglycerate mutase